MGMPVIKPGTITCEVSVADSIISIAAQESALKNKLTLFSGMNCQTT